MRSAVLSPRVPPSPPVTPEVLADLMGRVRREPGAFPTVAALARHCGWPEAVLDRAFLEHAHASAGTFLARARIEAAWSRLPGCPGPAGAVGAACGFPDPADFEARFLRGTGMAPEACRALGGGDPAAGFALALPAGYRAEDALAYHGRDPLSRSERTADGTLWKALVLEGRPRVLELAFRPGAARVRVAGPPLEPAALGRVHRMAVRMLGMDADPEPFERFVRGRDLGPLVARHPGLRIPLTADVWESLVWAVLGQQVNLAFAYTLRRRLTERCGAPAGAGLLAHPGPAAVAALEPADLKPLQFSRSKAEYLVALARAVAAGALPLEELPEGPASLAERRLAAERGVGPWTTHYVLMRGCGFADCVPLGDSGLNQALQRHYGLDHRPTAREAAALMAPFAPYRSLATFHFWASLKGVPA